MSLCALPVTELPGPTLREKALAVGRSVKVQPRRLPVTAAIESNLTHAAIVPALKLIVLIVK